MLQAYLKRVKGDKVIWSVVLLLALFSLLSVYSATGSLAYRMDKNASFYMIKQVGVLGLGMFLIYLVHRINYTRFAKWAVILFGISVPLLLYTLLFGTTLNDGARWIRLPVINLTFQTSDLAKLSLFMLLARMLSAKQMKIKDFKKGFVPVLVPVIVVCALIAPANLSTALMLGMTCCILFYIGRVKVAHIGLLALAGIVLIMMVWGISKATGYGRAATWEKRIANFAGKENAETAKDDNFQMEQGKIAIANGGVFGRGPGNSQQRNFVPHPYSDWIFAIIIEEYGLLGGAAIVSLYLIFLWRSILIFRRCPYAFGAFLAVGLSITLVFQAMLNMAVVVHLVPTTGLTLPLISMGGSSIWFTSVAVGIVLSVSRYVDEEEGRRVRNRAVVTDNPEPLQQTIEDAQPAKPTRRKVAVQ
jgi:cell division protein FtsW